MSENLPTVSVIVPAREAQATVGKTIDSILGQSYPRIVEIIVAAADRPTAETASGHGAVVIHNPSGSTPAGLNLAIAAASGDVVVRCDAHAELPPEYVQRAVELLLTTGAEAVGGMQVPVGFGYMERSIATAMSDPVGAGDARYRIGGEPGPVETVYLGVYRRDTLIDLGGFDEAFARSQDYELNHRIIDGGGVVWFDPRLRVAYTPRGSLKDLALQYYRYGAAKRQLSGVHPGSLRWRQLAAPTLILILIAAVVASIWVPWAALALPSYLALLLMASLRHGSLAPGVTASLAVIHLSWGTGFLLADRRAPDVR